jgi:MFS family permease
VRSALGRSFESLSVPNYRLYFAGQLVSLSGNWMQIVAEMWLILQLTDSGVAVGVTSALQFVPMLLFGAWGGLLADRLPKRRLLILTQALMAIPALALWSVTAAGVVTPAMVFALVFARGAVNAVDNPTRQSFVMEMVGGDRIVNAVSLNSVLIHSARIVGPAGAGALIATVGVEPCFLVNALSFVAMIVALRAMEPAQLSAAPRADREPGAVRAGVAYVAANPSLAIPMAMMALVGTLGFNFQVILPLLANFTFDGGAAAYTALAAAMAAGSVVGALAAGARGRVGPRLLVVAALGFGGLAAVAAAAPTLPLAAIALAPVGAASVTFAAGVNSSLQLGADPTMRGRVMALYSIVFLGSTPIGGPIAGWLSEAASPRAALLLAAAAAATAAVGAWLAYQRLGLELATKSRSECERPAATPAPEPAGTGGEAEDSGGAVSEDFGGVALGGRWRWRVTGGHPVAAEAGGSDEPDRLERRGRLDVEADSVALLDRGDGGLAAAPGEGDEDRVAGTDRGDLRPDPGQSGRDQGEGADRPQPLEGDPPRALRRQARRRAGAGERSRHRLARARRASEQDAHDRGDHPPAAGERERDVVGVLVGADHGHRSERRGDPGDEQHRDPEQVAEQHR